MKVEILAEESQPNLTRLEEHGTYLCRVLSANVFPMNDDWATPGISFAFEVLDGTRRYIPYSVWCMSYTKLNGEVQLDDEGKPEINHRKSLLARGNWISLLAAVTGNEGKTVKVLYSDSHTADVNAVTQFKLKSDKYGLVPFNNRQDIPDGEYDDYNTLIDLIGCEVILETVRDNDGYITIAKNGWHNAKDLKQWDVEHKIVKA